MAIKRTIREQVTTELRQELVAGGYSAGEVLREIDLATRFGVSRGPIRDAFLQLSQEGFLAYQANRGVTVRHPPHPANRPFILSLRRQIEIYNIECGLSGLTDASLTEIEAALVALGQACESGDVAAIARDDMAFHETILHGCGGDDFIQPWRQICSRMLLAYTRLDNHFQIYEEHAAIFDAVRRRDIKDTIAALRINLA